MGEKPEIISKVYLSLSELRRVGEVPVCSFTLAVDRDFKNNGQAETDFIDIVAWRNTGTFVNQYFTKGRMAVVSGRLQIREWTDKEGNKRRSAEVVAENVYFGDSKKNDNAGGQEPPAGFVPNFHNGGSLPY